MSSEFCFKQIAKVCHEANRAYCQALGDNSQLPWDEAPNWQQDSVLMGVKLHFENDVTPEQSHESWMAQKIKDGWVYGSIKDVELKQHPCMRPYSELPLEQKAKDYIFRGIIRAMRG